MRRATHEAIVGALREELDRANERVRELEDRLDARSLTELSYSRAVAMPASEPEEPGVPQVQGLWGYASWDAPELPE